MKYTLTLSPRIIALATAGAATLGLTLNAALLRPVVKPDTTDGEKKGGEKCQS